jgi:hypothetical protein
VDRHHPPDPDHLLLCSGHRIGPAYPLILYYNQIVGALVKIYVFFRLDQQSWTATTRPRRDLASFQWFNTWSSRTMTFSAGSIRRRAADDGLSPPIELTGKSP